MLSELIDAALEQFRSDNPTKEAPPVEFLAQVKRQCAALPCPIGVTVFSHLVSLRYRHKFTVDRFVPRGTQYDYSAETGYYMFCIANSHCVEYQLPTQLDDLIRALPK